MHSEISSKLAELENDRGIRILYACESGSRAWGFASPDSDYDVRFIYAHPADWYLSIHKRDETLDLPLQEELDLRGWDLRKALRLFAKSNGSLLEWLHSPVIYHENAEVVRLWRSLVPDIISPKALACHYLGQCKRIWLGSLQGDRIRAKHYLYALRSLHCAQFVMERRAVAPVQFTRLLDVIELPSVVRGAIDGLVDAKSATGEHLTLAPDRRLHTHIELQLEALESVARNMTEFFLDTGLVDAFMHSVINRCSDAPDGGRRTPPCPV